ncbi:hypothetical protein [Nocardioides caricicola]|uniref:DUF2690 domain-containing protein n=1 Tax=Nocardioides caricicola TaxID=634770 RepID=A0ABW0N5I0_9ACTN
MGPSHDISGTYMKRNRPAPAKRRHTWATLAVLTLLTPILVTAQAQAAPATQEGETPAAAVGQQRGGNPFGCRAKIDYLGTEIGTGNRIEMRVVATCNRTLDELRVSGLIQRRDGQNGPTRNWKQCSNTNYCTVKVLADNPSGKQNWTGRVTDCVGDVSCTTMVRDGSTASFASMGWPCPTGATCWSPGLSVEYLDAK